MSSPTTQHPQHPPHGIGRYFAVYFALICLTFGTFFVAKALKAAETPNWVHFAAALSIACVKVSLVVMFFMHLKDAEGANKMVFIVSILFVLVLIFFVLEDMQHRFKLLSPRPAWTLTNKPLEEGKAPLAAPGAPEAAPHE